MEMNRGANQIDNNVIWDVRNSEPGTRGQRGAAGSGILLHASEREIVAHNLIGRCDNVGVWPVLRPERNNAGSGREHEIHDNDAVEWLDLAAWRARGWDQGGSVAKLDVNFDADRLELTVKGEADLPRVPMVRIVKSGSGGR